ncbi:hypothetical protein BM221_005823 [Beauveria bassiana]|uniref:GTP-binding protein EsdC n=1 Tax=Beauveria bassiana TaxID=176275 RepID=A0A2N6NK47_BEABA|nr:hypothetical protein BM221_005823 [Beauveria bassiana]
MSAIQLSFSLRVSSGVKAVHLLGSWDNYVGQLPLSRDKTSSKSGSWKGTFRFQNTTLQTGQRYWYYYIIDGYHIKAPKPMSPHATKHLLESDYHGNSELEELAARFGTAGLDDDLITDFSTSPVSSVGSAFSYRSDSSSPSSSLSGYSTPSSDCSSCTCERYGITRRGERVKLDCGGSRCGHDDDDDYSDDSCASDAYESEDERVRPHHSHHGHGHVNVSRRHGIIVS